MSLITFQDARPWARSIKERVSTHQMPPWHIDRSVGVQKFKNDMSLSDEQVDTIVKWVDQGDLRQRLEFAARPSSLQIWVTQEDLWVFENLLHAIANTNKEKNAIKEARALGITTVSLIDTDCDPDHVDLPIPGNDDGIRSIELIMRHLAEACLVGSQSAAAMKQKGDKPAPQAEMAAAGEAKEGNV